MIVRNLDTPTASRLTLRRVTRMMRIAMECSPDAFAAVAEIEVPEGWPQYPEAFSSDLPMHREPWNGYLFIRNADGALIGNGGFVAPPDPGGKVEIGYEIAPGYRNHGYASEAARAMIAMAFENGAKAVIAHTEASPNASNAVLRKVGMSFVAELPNEELGHIWRWQIGVDQCEEHAELVPSWWPHRRTPRAHPDGEEGDFLG